jgi:isoleucyl-tRNA synthetase
MDEANYDLVDLQKNVVWRWKTNLVSWICWVWIWLSFLHYSTYNILVKIKDFPGDFIAEGVDQTRGWFYTLHAIATLVFDKVAYKKM